jgi:mono/diheme cytochrome c family protein
MCNGDNDNNNHSDSLLVDSNPRDYEVYFTQDDLDNLKDVMPDSVGKVFSAAEYTGMSLFMKNCNVCHPGGEKGKGPSLIDKPLPDFLIHFQVRNGLGDMPAFSKEELPKEDVKKIVLFIRALREDYKEYQNDPNY